MRLKLPDLARPGPTRQPAAHGSRLPDGFYVLYGHQLLVKLAGGDVALASDGRVRYSADRYFWPVGSAEVPYLEGDW